MSTFDSWNTELYHHGILGQKWGIRRFQNKDGTRTPAGEKQRDKNEKKKRTKDLSDAELESRIKRLRLEKEYRELNTSKLSRAIDYVRKFNKERAENQEKKSKYIAAKNDKKRLSFGRKAVEKLASAPVEAAADVVNDAVKRVGGTFVSLIPDSKQVKSGFKWASDYLKNSAKTGFNKVKKKHNEKKYSGPYGPTII